MTDENVETRCSCCQRSRRPGGSEDPEAQAEAILAESEERTVHRPGRRPGRPLAVRRHRLTASGRCARASGPAALVRPRLPRPRQPARALGLIEDARLAMDDGAVAGGSIILARLEVDYLRQLYYRVGERPACRAG